MATASVTPNLDDKTHSLDELIGTDLVGATLSGATQYAPIIIPPFPWVENTVTNNNAFAWMLTPQLVPYADFELQDSPIPPTANIVGMNARLGDMLKKIVTIYFIYSNNTGLACTLTHLIRPFVYRARPDHISHVIDIRLRKNTLILDAAHIYICVDLPSSALIRLIEAADSTIKGAAEYPNICDFDEFLFVTSAKTELCVPRRALKHLQHQIKYQINKETTCTDTIKMSELEAISPLLGFERCNEGILLNEWSKNDASHHSMLFSSSSEIAALNEIFIVEFGLFDIDPTVAPPFACVHGLLDFILCERLRKYLGVTPDNYITFMNAGHSRQIIPDFAAIFTMMTEELHYCSCNNYIAAYNYLATCRDPAIVRAFRPQDDLPSDRGTPDGVPGSVNGSGHMVGLRNATTTVKSCPIGVPQWYLHYLLDSAYVNAVKHQRPPLWTLNFAVAWKINQRVALFMEPRCVALDNAAGGDGVGDTHFERCPDKFMRIIRGALNNIIIIGPYYRIKLHSIVSI